MVRTPVPLQYTVVLLYTQVSKSLLKSNTCILGDGIYVGKDQKSRGRQCLLVCEGVDGMREKLHGRGLMRELLQSLFINIPVDTLQSSLWSSKIKDLG